MPVDEFTHSLMNVAVAQVCQNVGWHAIHSTAMEVLSDCVERYITHMAKKAHDLAEVCNRTQPNLDDVGIVFKQMGVKVADLKEYVQHVGSVPFAHPVPQFPAKCPSQFHFPQDSEIATRPEWIEDNLPSMLGPEENDEEKCNVPLVKNDNRDKTLSSNSQSRMVADFAPPAEDLVCLKLDWAGNLVVEGGQDVEGTLPSIRRPKDSDDDSESSSVYEERIRKEAKKKAKKQAIKKRKEEEKLAAQAAAKEKQEKAEAAKERKKRAKKINEDEDYANGPDRKGKDPPLKPKKQKVQAVKRPRGRPKGSGKNQRAAAAMAAAVMVADSAEDMEEQEDKSSEETSPEPPEEPTPGPSPPSAQQPHQQQPTPPMVLGVPTLAQLKQGYDDDVAEQAAAGSKKEKKKPAEKVGRGRKAHKETMVPEPKGDAALPAKRIIAPSRFVKPPAAPSSPSSASSSATDPFAIPSPGQVDSPAGDGLAAKKGRGGKKSAVVRRRSGSGGAVVKKKTLAATTATPRVSVGTKRKRVDSEHGEEEEEEERGLIMETVKHVMVDAKGDKIWICPGCKRPDDGSPMIGCDDCDDWYHWPCVGLVKEPTYADWYCPKCAVKHQGKGKKKPVRKAPPKKKRGK